MTRAELAHLITIYDGAAGSRATDSDQQALARREIELIRARLSAGDFQIGDQISLEVQGQPQLTGAFSVVAGPEGVALRLPMIGDVGLRGVLRSEVEGHLRNEISRFVRDPQVHAEAMIRISVLEGVDRPGFYPVAAEALLTDVLMTAGGPSQRARLDRIRIERGKDRIWQGDALQRAITEGRTLDQLSLRAGDRVVIPERGERSWFTVLQAGAILVPAIYAISQIF
jgi:protein involved in polysaccharide export with SLBB domain